MPQRILTRPTNNELHWASSLPDAVRDGDSLQRRFPDFREILRSPKHSRLLSDMQVERQAIGSCQGESIANSQEAMYHFKHRTGLSKTPMPDLSEIAAYQFSEWLMSPRYVGGDSGSSMHSGVRLLLDGIPELEIQPGIPLESEWPRDVYYSNSKKMASAVRGMDVIPSVLDRAEKLPPFMDMVAGTSAGLTGHIGVYWRVRWKTLDGKKLMYTAPTSGGGHAVEIIWAREINGEWFLCTWNSHGWGYFLMNESCYEKLRSKDFEPFGGFLLWPDSSREIYTERYDAMTRGGGYWL